MPQFSPKIDIAFKKIFGVEENKDLLISLINSIVSKQDKITDVTILNPYNLRDYKDSKESILDIKARSSTGEKYNIEIQIKNEGSYENRALSYWSKLYTQSLKVGGSYADLEKTIGIHILNFNYFSDLKKYHNKFHIVEEETHIPYFKKLEIHTIELSKFCDNSKADLKEIVTKVKNSLDIWVAFLTRHDLLSSNNLPGLLNDNNLKKALTILDVMGFNDEEREIYEDKVKWLLDEYSALQKARVDSKAEGLKEGVEKGHKEGLKEGVRKGRKEGLKEGLKEGVRKGRKEGADEQINKIAINMLRQDVDIKTIADFTSLSVNNILKLKNNL